MMCPLQIWRSQIGVRKKAGNVEIEIFLLNQVFGYVANLAQCR